MSCPFCALGCYDPQLEEAQLRAHLASGACDEFDPKHVPKHHHRAMYASDKLMDSCAVCGYGLTNKVHQV